MDISVCVVTYNAVRTIGKCLESIIDQAPHGGGSEILVVDGCSTDDTQKIICGFGGSIRIVQNQKRTIASNRNVAICEAMYPYIAFTDADCVVPHNWLKVLSESFEAIDKLDASLAGVGGGSATPAGNSPFQASLGIALDSFIGSLGSAQGMNFKVRCRVPSIPCLNALYSRVALEKIGGFDERLENMCEDADINYRLNRSGHKLYFIPGIPVEHRARESLMLWCANMYNYGVGRARIMRKHHTLFSPAYAAAVLFVPALFLASLLGLLWPAALLVWLYVPVIMLMGLLLAMNKNSYSGLRVGLILIGTHIPYSAGLLRGFIMGYPGSSEAVKAEA